MGIQDFREEVLQRLTRIEQKIKIKLEEHDRKIRVFEKGLVIGLFSIVCILVKEFIR